MCEVGVYKVCVCVCVRYVVRCIRHVCKVCVYSENDVMQVIMVHSETSK